MTENNMTTAKIEAAAEASDTTAAETEAEVNEEQLTDEEAFDAAFNEATDVLDTDTTGEADVTANNEGSDATDTGGDDDADGGDGDADGGAGDDAGTGDVAAAGDDSTGDGGSAATEADETDKPSARELELQATIDALTAAAKPPVVDVAPVVEEEADEDPTLTDEETAKVAAYREEWGDVATAEALIRREENKVIVGYVFKQVKDALAPLLEAHETRNGRDQYTDLVSLVPDYDEVRDKMVSWVDKLPAGVTKNIYTEVTKTGTPAEVAEMINAFKKATSYEPPKTSATAAAATAAAAAAAGAKPAASGAAKKPKGSATAALRVVKTVRSKTNTGGVDVNDFDGAFDEFAQKK